MRPDRFLRWCSAIAAATLLASCAGSTSGLDGGVASSGGTTAGPSGPGSGSGGSPSAGGTSGGASSGASSAGSAGSAGSSAGTSSASAGSSASGGSGSSSGGSISGSSSGAGSSGGSGGLSHWHPGHYVGLSSAAPSAAETGERGPLLAMKAFTGIQVEYDWWTSEGAEGDYDAGFRALDEDLAAAADAGKQLAIFFQYKNFTQGGNAVPAYLRDAGPWCETASGSLECGQFEMNPGAIAMIWQGQDAGGTADRLHAWVEATGDHAFQGPHASTIAGVVFSESACSNCQKDPAYSQDGYLAALENDVAAAGASFPGVPVFQYINDLPGPNPEEGYLFQYGAWAQQHPYAGAGCPDVAPSPYPKPGPASSLGCSTGNLPAPFAAGEPPGYAVLRDAGAQGIIPFDVAIEAPDYSLCRTPSLSDTWTTALLPASADGMAAQYVVWIDHPRQSSTDAFALPDVVNWIEDAGAFPNAATPTW